MTGQITRTNETKQPTLLIVDDNPDNLFVLQELFAVHLPICRVISTTHATAALNLAQEHEPDVILLDLQMSEMNGIDVCRHIKASRHASHIPVFIMTAHRVTPEMKAQGFEVGADDFITKPVDAVELTARIRRLLRNKEVRDQMQQQNRELENTIRHKTQEVIRNQQFYQALFENSGDAILIHTRDENILDVNTRACELLCYSRGELLSLKLSRIFKDVGQIAHTAIIQSEPDTNVYRYETALVTKNGDVRHVDVSLNRVDAEDDIFQTIVRDITARIRVDEKLRKSRAGLAEAQRIAKMGSWDVDLHSLAHTWSDELFNIFSRDAHEYTPSSTSFLDVTHQGDRALLQSAMNAAVNDRKPLQLEIRIQTPDGFEKVVNIVGRTLHDDVGRPLRLIGTVQDVTERVRTREEIGRRDREFETLVENAPDLIARYDRAKKLQYINHTVERETGIAVANLLGKSRTELGMAEQLHAKWDETLDSVFTTGQPQIFECRCNRNGQQYYCHSRLVPEYSSEGAVDTVLSISRDFTNMRRLEHQYQQAQKMESVGQLAGGIAHDFNNLLTVINGHADLALLTMDAEEKNTYRVREISKTAKRATDVARQLLAFSRREMIEPQHIDLNHVIMDIDKMLRRLIGEDIELITITSEENCRIFADSGQIEQLVTNLVVNARDAIGKTGRIFLKTNTTTLSVDTAQLKAGPHVQLIVQDTGSGIPDQVLEHIFEPFFTTKQKGKGTGLGLATCYGIAQQHKGWINVASVQERGSTFTVCFPLSTGDVERRKTGESLKRIAGGGETILVAEDEPTVRELVIQLLKRKGYQVYATAHGEEALQKVSQWEKGTVDLLITDVVMPRMGGYPLVRALRKMQPNLSVLFMSGYNGESASGNLVEDANTMFIQKPFSPVGFVQKVRQLLDGQDELVPVTQENETADLNSDSSD
jgi:two-component system, cell cycle sensor histidine kinase and response regulator CckA